MTKQFPELAVDMSQPLLQESQNRDAIAVRRKQSKSGQSGSWGSYPGTIKSNSHLLRSSLKFSEDLARHKGIKRKYQHMKSFLPFLRILVVLAVLAGAWQGIWSYTVDSEIWATTLSQFLGQEGHHYFSLYYRLLFHLPLKVIYFFPLSNYEHLIAAKAVFAVNGLVLCFLTFRLFQRLCLNALVPWLSLLFLMSNPTWLGEFFRIRSDFLAMNFSLAALLVFFNPKRADDFKKFGMILLLLAFAGLSTPKSVLWNLPLAVFLIFAGNWNWRSSGFKWIFGGLGISVVALGLTFYFSPFLQDAYALAWNHFSEALQTYGPFDEDNWGLDWLFVWNSVFGSPFHWILILMSFFVAPFLKSSLGRKQKWFLLGSLWLLLVLFAFYSPKHAYLWAALMPLVMIPSVFVVDWIFQRAWEFLKIAWLTVLAFVFAFWMVTLAQHHSGEETFRLVKDLEKFIAGKPLVIFDSMGLMPREKNIMAYIGVGESWGVEVAEKAFVENPPDIVIETDRIRAFFSHIHNGVLVDNYIEVQEGLWLRKESMKIPEGRITSAEKINSLFNQQLLWGW